MLYLKHKLNRIGGTCCRLDLCYPDKIGVQIGPGADRTLPFECNGQDTKATPASIQGCSKDRCADCTDVILDHISVRRNVGNVPSSEVDFTFIE